MPPKGKGRSKAAAGHQLASALPIGEEMKDLRKKSWYLGAPIGSGGFGLIYLADDEKKGATKDKAKYVIKVEPHGNGPLYCEVAFYQRAARQETLTTWKKTSNASYVGIPAYIAHGLHTFGKENLRFMVMPRYGSDLHSLWLKANKSFQRATVSQVAIELINSLEFMHENEYVHADLKGANILLGYKNPNQIFLVDFGLAFRYIVDGVHKEYQEDPRKAHDGTIEYTSRDAHRGVAPSRRADMEILGYVLLHWLAGRLPWDANLNNKNLVRDQKIKSMDNIKEFIAETYPDAKSQKADEIQKYLENVSKLKYDEKPNYDKLRKIFKDALKSLSVGAKAKINFEGVVQEPDSPVIRKGRMSKAKPLASATNTPDRYSPQSTATSQSEEEEELNPKKRTRRTKVQSRQEEVEASTAEEEEFTSSMASSSTSEPKPQKKGRKKVATATKKKTKKSQPPKSRNMKTSVENTDMSTDENEEICDTMTKKYATAERKKSLKKLNPIEIAQKSIVTSNKKPPQKQLPIKNRKKQEAAKSMDSEEEISIDESIDVVSSSEMSEKDEQNSNESNEKSLKSTTEDGSYEESNVVDSTNDMNTKSPPVRQSPRNKQVPGKSSLSTSNIAKSRYSMAPLHTKSVLGKDDSLTGKYSGKHPVIIRRRKVKRPRTDATTQTTPNLRKSTSRV